MTVNRIHRLQEARIRSGISFRALARRTGYRVSELRRQETSNDISLQDLYRWQAALGVPLAELLTEPPEDLEEMNRLRAGLIQLMRSVKSLQQTELTEAQDAYLQNMLSTLKSLMPELKDVRGWPIYGERRASSPTRIETHMVPARFFFPEASSET